MGMRTPHGPGAHFDWVVHTSNRGECPVTSQVPDGTCASKRPDLPTRTITFG